MGCQNRRDLGRRRRGRATPFEKEKRQDTLSQGQEERSRGLETATGFGRLYGRQETAPSLGGRVWRGNAPDVETQEAENEDLDKSVRNGRPPAGATT